MADSSSKTADELEHQRIWEQGDLLIEGFRRLKTKYERPTHLRHDPESIEEPLSSSRIDESPLEVKDGLLNQLESQSLPTLHRQITNLSHSLKPLGLLNQPEAKFQIVSLIQSELEQTIDQIKTSIIVICPQPICAPNRIDDQHLKQFKSSRLQSLKAKFRETSQNICLVFRSAYELLEQMKHSPDELSRLNYTHFPGDWLVNEVFESLEWTIECIRGSELGIAQRDWFPDLDGIDRLLFETRMLLDPIIHFRQDGQAHRKLVREPVIHLAQLAIPLIKISKLFFTKLSKRGLNKRQVPRFTEMCSDQLESLAGSLGKLTSDILQLLLLLNKADEAHGAVTSHQLVEIATCIKGRFEAPLLVLMLYIVPDIPDNDGSTDQIYYKNWFVTWNTQRILATENFLNAAKSFETDQLHLELATVQIVG
ncbi:hypothetical protein PGT21_025421 [Puccinia graminis f. sp. tritici]|uniref:Uncharacterized protein n=1 Tax=Puccinia graminis f. sp. tritici TaxID=56615 RepID=A0A5B0PYK1_PUCGR|nr:hypothetical protein PGT21_025421 [Puccinia graminis f. sp. tritici]KAA1120951.1 hypothetical protein PGTUg99_021940 [Puccinia graminis f. sp. tritici]